jgi:ketosteroid isomerase-like protein
MLYTAYMYGVHEDLLKIEHALGGGTGDTYREHLTDDAVVVVPGAAIDREQTAQAIDATPGWDEFTITNDRLVQPTADTAILTYRWSSRRGDDTYDALMSSVYARQPDGAWKLVLHQQTPLG